MSEIEKVKARAKLTDEEIDRAWPNEAQVSALDDPERFVKELLRCGRLVAQAQQNKDFSDPSVCIKDQNQTPPKYIGHKNLVDNLTLAFATEVQQDMLQAGWVRVEPKEFNPIQSKGE